MFKWFKLSLPNRILIFIVIGIILGLILGPAAGTYLKPIGDIFVSLIKMMVLLLVIPALISGMAAMEDPKKIGGVGVTMTVIFVATTVVAGILALLLGNIIGPGRGLSMALPEGFKYTEPTQTMLDVFKGIVPSNPFAAITQGKLLSVLFIVIFTGAALIALKDKGSVLKSFFSQWADMSMKMLSWIMELAPYGAGALIAYSVGVHGPRILGPLALFVAVVYIGEILILIEYTIIMVIAKLRPFKFFKGIAEPAMVAFTTCSSMANPGVNVRATEKMGVPNGVATFGITLGNVINMDGTCLYQALAVIFVSQAYGLPLTLETQKLVVFIGSVFTISMVTVLSAKIFKMLSADSPILAGKKK
ncbi:MAG: cation:dicarboxylase symporter family transporter [Spirochaeta sp.]|nr:cation:dicarboxylase symporter family transporter [Spirochaeta sp.]